MNLSGTVKKIFIDTWAWVTLANENDAWHEVAEILNQDLVIAGYLYVTTNFVLDESYTLIQARVHKQAAIDFGEEIRVSKETGVLKIIHISEEIEEEAWRIFKTYKDKDFSFTDCTSFVVMQQLGINEAFTDDVHFAQFGFTRLPGAW